VRRIVLLTLGWEDLPRSVSIHGDTSGVRLREPVPAVLLECDGGWVLLDTGFNPALVRDPALARRFHDPTRGIIPILASGDDPLEASLERAGVPVGAIDAVALSHLHNDHAGGLRHFAGRVPVHLQRAELAFGLSDPAAEEHGIFRIDFDDPSIEWMLADGDVEIAPGVTAISSPGHTPGHQSFLVELDPSVGGGGYVFAFDAADLLENIDDELAVGGFINCTPEDTIEQIRRLKAIARERGYRLVPGHDPIAWPELSVTLASRFTRAE
jgi:glyoxylase-like metal-dependent hydrolase (beta-lactamase superfamily II)